MRNFELHFLKSIGLWTHGLTITFCKSSNGFPPSHEEVCRRSRLFLSRLNRHIYGRHGTRRKKFRIASAGFIGFGAYGNHPHVHLVLAGPQDFSIEAFTDLISSNIKSTRGLGSEFDIQTYYGQRWLDYMLKHGFQSLMPELTFTAKCPVH